MEDTSLFSRDWNEYATRIHTMNVNKGFWPPNRNIGEALCLIISELVESDDARQDGAMDDKLVDRIGADVEIADALIRALDLAGFAGVDLSWEGFAYIFEVDPYTSYVEDLFEITRIVAYALEADRKGKESDYQFELMRLISGLISIMLKYHMQEEVIDEKLAYNDTRPFKHGKKY